MLVYLAGPYSGDVEANIEAARQVAVELWDKGYYVLCPHMNSAFFDRYCKKATWDAFMLGYLTMLHRCDAVVMLPGWRGSRGARIERSFADNRGVPVYEWPDVPPGGDDDL